MTFREAYEYGQDNLKQAGIAEAALDAWYLLEFATGLSRATYFVQMNEEMKQEDEVAFCGYIERRKMRIPIQHITGTQEFMGLPFSVNEHVLVPRQDTETLVETVLHDLQPGMEVLDMCTGSGCILVSLMRHRMGIIGTGVDVSSEALLVAERNAKDLGVQVTLLQSDLFEQVEGRYDIIVSNPPYIRTAVIEELEAEVRLHDPMLALDGKEDGLYFYREIIKASTKFLKEKGKLYFEIGHDQGADVKELMEEAGFSLVTVKKDLAGLDRVVFGVYI